MAKLFEALAKRGHLLLFCVDKAHNVEQAGRSFRKEFKEAIINTFGVAGDRCF